MRRDTSKIRRLHLDIVPMRYRPLGIIKKQRRRLDVDLGVGPTGRAGEEGRLRARLLLLCGDAGDVVLSGDKMLSGEALERGVVRKFSYKWFQPRDQPRRRPRSPGTGECMRRLFLVPFSIRINPYDDV